MKAITEKNWNNMLLTCIISLIFLAGVATHASRKKIHMQYDDNTFSTVKK